MDLSLLVPSTVKELINMLVAAGYEAYIVGGCVRDLIMGVKPHDWDICTSAKPDEIIKVFEKCYKTLDVGSKFGTVVVIANGEQYEITTYRIDGEYSNNRRPDNVEFTSDITEDLARRDFTVNAIAYDPISGNDLIDPYNGLSDIKNKTLTCVGDAEKRFNEDGLRIMRALRFAAVLDFKIDEKTSKAIHDLKHLLRNISKERIQIELCKLLMSNNCGNNVLREYSDVICEIIPAVVPMIGFEQNNLHHTYDVWEHTLHCLNEYDEYCTGFDLVTRLAMLLHDSGKPLCYSTDENGIGHFYGHAKLSADICKASLLDLKFSTSIIDDVVQLVYMHDMVLIENKSFIKRLLNKIGKTQFLRLAEVHIHDTLGQADWLMEERVTNVKNILCILDEIIADDECFKLKDLKINGNDLINIGAVQGRQLGELLDDILSNVIEGKLKNNRQELLDYASKVLTNE